MQGLSYEHLLSVAGDEVFSYSGKYFPVRVMVTGVKPPLIPIVRTELWGIVQRLFFHLLLSQLRVSFGKYIPR